MNGVLRRGAGAQRQCGGFTMLEMMAVLAVITIMALIAIPSYLDRIVRAQVEASLPLADIAKKPVAEAWKTLLAFPDDNAAALLPVADKIVNNHVSSLTVDHGAIHLMFGNRANGSIQGKILTMRPAVVEDAPVVPVAWVCGHAEAPGKMTVIGTNRTSIPEMYLPLECRRLQSK
jgi:type IV pilus assembly protein PilA